MSPLRFGLLGLGKHGERYAEHLARGEIEGARLTAVWRRDRKEGLARAGALGARYCAEPSELVEAGDVDAVIMAVPVGRHLELASLVAAAHKPLLLEKPLAPTRSQAERLEQLFEAAGVSLTVAQTLRFDPLIAAIAGALSEIGPLTGFAFEQRLEPRGLAWEDEPSLAGGGVLLQTGVHALDALMFLTAPSRAAVLYAGLASVAYRKLEDHAILELRLEGAARAAGRKLLGSVSASKIGRSRHMRFSLYGEQGALEADFVARSLMRVFGRQQQVERVPEAPTVAALLRAFVEHLSGRAPNPVPPSSVRATMNLIWDAYALAAEAQNTGGSNFTSPLASS